MAACLRGPVGGSSSKISNNCLLLDPVANHFVDVNKMVNLGSGGQRQVDDVTLSRYACYLVAQNGDPTKQPIAFAQTYFAIQCLRAHLCDRPRAVRLDGGYFETE